MLLLLLTLAAAPKPAIEGLETSKFQVEKLGPSELASGTVTVRCFDLPEVLLVELDDPGLEGAKDAWLKKKPAACSGDDTDAVHLDRFGGYGSIQGTRGDFVFVTSADTFGDRAGVRVFSAKTGLMVLDDERSTQKPASLQAEGASLWLRYHVALPATCDPVGEKAEACWKQLREGAKVPAALELGPPPCAAVLKGKKVTTGSVLLALPVEIDLNAPTTKRFRPGEATCALAP